MKTLFNVTILSFILLLMPLELSAKAGLQAVEFSAQELKNIQGHYSTVYGYVYIQVNKKVVSTRIDGKYIQLIKKSDGRIYPRYKLLRLIPISLGKMSFSLKNDHGKNQIVMHEINKKGKPKKAQIVAQKFKPVAIPALWKQRLGKYNATLLKGKSKIRKIRLALKRGVLVAYINKLKSPYPLLALSPSKLYSPSAGHNKDQPIHIATLSKQLSLKYGKNSLLLKKL